MCGIVGAIAERPIEGILIEGLKQLEYRGYDSAGVAIFDASTRNIQRSRVHGKVALLEETLKTSPILGKIGIAHTRWATHGKPNVVNAHPHTSQDEVSIVHNGIIENHRALRQFLLSHQYQFESETDSEVIAHLLHYHFAQELDPMRALQRTAEQLKGAFAICAFSRRTPDCLYAIRSGSPLVIGIGIDEVFVVSDPLAVSTCAQKYIYLEEGDIACVSRAAIDIRDFSGNAAHRVVHTYSAEMIAANKGQFPHYMLKEIHDQPDAVCDILQCCTTQDDKLASLFAKQDNQIMQDIEHISIVACGSSFNAGLLAKYWLESLANIPASVEIASEYRYRHSVTQGNTLLVALSQSGETADTLAAMRHAKQMGCKRVLAICNAPESSLARESDVLMLIRSGKEVGVAATKTFTSQLLALSLLTLLFSNPSVSASYIQSLKTLPELIAGMLQLDPYIQLVAKQLVHYQHALFIARGEHYPIALEGALKLKEISYIHAEAYAAGELKHGPIALIDENLPVIVLAPNNALFEKCASNIQEIQARGGRVFVLSDHSPEMFGDDVTHIQMPTVPDFISPMLYNIPLQLLAYHIAVLRGTDVDQPRNLAKSVTVE